MVDRARIGALCITSLVGGCVLEAVAIVLFLSRFRSPCTFSVCDVGPAVFVLSIEIAVVGLCLVVSGALGSWVLHDARNM